LELVRWRRGGEEVGVHAVGEGCGGGGWLDGRLVRGGSGGGVGCGGLLSHIVAVLLPSYKAKVVMQRYSFGRRRWLFVFINS
jgi:hypothetical protein